MAGCRSRCRVVQESDNRVENVAALEESAEDLRVVAVQELSTELNGVISGDDGEVVAHLSTLEYFINIRSKKEWISETEGW